METIEKTGATVEEAVAAGMKELGVTSPSQVMVEVLQEPDKGIMGEGAQEAIVRLVYMGAPRSDKPLTSIVSNPPPADETIKPVTTISSYDPSQDNDEGDEAEEEEGMGKSAKVAFDDADEDAQVGKQVLDELLEKMDVEGEAYIYRAESTRPEESTHWILNIEGNNINRLIGRRGETLASLQYIVRLMVSRRLQRRANIIVDAGHYKSNRSDRLRRLANRMADQAVRQRRTVTLEPMPPHERRIIHLTLRRREDVSTKSVGEGKERKVTILPQ